MNFIRGVLSQVRIALVSDILSKLRLVRQWQWLDPIQTHELTQHRLQKVLDHAYRCVPYYRDVLTNSGVVHGVSVIDMDRFEKIPLLDKETIRSRAEDLKSSDLHSRKWYLNSSGGSTGRPVNVIQYNDYHDWMQALAMLYDSWTGYILSAPRIVLWGSMKDIYPNDYGFKVQAVRWLRNEVWLSAFRMGPEQMRSYVDTINTRKPHQILAYVESIFELSRFVEKRGCRVHSPKAIVTSAGTLFPEMRDTIERVFQAPVFNRYGCRELGTLGAECDFHSGLHVASPTNYVEILRADGTPAQPGEAGEIVVTSLTNLAMPLIRYRIGDMGVRASAPCACGRGSPLLKEIRGRTSDAFLKRDGTKVFGQFFIIVMFFQDWIDRYQVIQEDYEHLRVIIVPRNKRIDPRKSYAKELAEIRTKILAVMGPNCRVEYDFAKDITPTPSGKYRYTISKMIQ